MSPLRGIVALGALLLLAACGPPPSLPAPAPAPEPTGLPPVPSVEGTLRVDIVHPAPDTPRPGVDSVQVFGSVGTGRATLEVNGQPVTVAANGAFLAFVSLPANDTLRLAARAGGEVATGETWYRRATPAATPATPVTTTEYLQPLGARVLGADTLATGSDVTNGRPTPGGTFRWFLPRGARLTLTGERGEMVRAQLDASSEAWFPRDAVEITDDLPGLTMLPAPELLPADRWTDVRLGGEGLPFRVTTTPTGLTLEVHGASAPSGAVAVNDPVVRDLRVEAPGGDVARVVLSTHQPVWGYKVFYTPDGALVLRVRRPPRIDASNPLRGVRIAIDPGHPPAGATGPTALTEAEANLGIGLRLAEQLRFRGAEVLLTRSTVEAVGLTERVDMAAGWNADLLVSVHNNAFPEGVNPFLRNGTSTYYFHGFAEPFASALNDEIVAVTGITDLGTLHGNLALARPTWMPSVLTESLFMAIPEQEAALRSAIFLEGLAAAHLRGIERFLAGAGRRP